MASMRVMTTYSNEEDDVERIGDGGKGKFHFYYKLSTNNSILHNCLLAY